MGRKSRSAETERWLAGAGLDVAATRRLVDLALAEDRADHDVTTDALVPPDQRGRGAFLVKASGVIAGLPVIASVFAAVDGSLAFGTRVSDGETVQPGQCVAEVEGSLASILRAERVALNLLCRLSGVATAANAVVRALEGTGCQLRDTRKTTPGLRALEKYAVRLGGGANHRMDLADGILIKDNHLAALRARGLSIADAVLLARDANPRLRVEVEVTTVDEARQAIAAGADELLLDNMPLARVREVVALLVGRESRPALEASGGITLASARRVAEAGVDYISMGAITHSASALDISLEMEPA